MLGAPLPVVLNGVFAHIFFVGLPTMLFARAARIDRPHQPF